MKADLFFRRNRRGFSQTLVQVGIELVNEDAARPAVLDCFADVKHAHLVVLQAVEQDAIMFPGNLCTKAVTQFRDPATLRRMRACI